MQHADCPASRPPPQASEHGHNGVLDVLVELGADLHVRNALGWTALHYAAFNGRLSAVKRLLTAGLPPDARTHASWTPLHHAAVRGNHRTIRALVAAGADKSVLSQQGVTVAEMLRALTKLRTEEEDLQACARTPPPRCCARPRPLPCCLRAPVCASSVDPGHAADFNQIESSCGHQVVSSWKRRARTLNMPLLRRRRASPRWSRCLKVRAPSRS
jgi:hypothetical protein